MTICLVASFYFSACTSAPKQQAGPITLEFWTLQLNTFKPYLEAVIHRYEATHPGVRIRWIDVPFSEGEKKTLTAMLSPMVPDVLNLNPEFSALLASRKALLDMNQWVTPAQRQQYLPVAWQAVTLGKSYAFGLPWYLSSSVTFYNRTLLNQVGYIHSPMTLDQLADLAKTLHDHHKGYALMPALTEGEGMLKEFRRQGVEPFDDQGHPHLVGVQQEAILAYWCNMFQQGWIPAESLTEGHQAAVDRYEAGSLGLLLAGANFFKLIQENAPDVAQVTGVAPQFPQTRFVDFSTMLLAVPARSQHPREAVDFALYVTNAENQQAFAQAAPVLPSIQSALASVSKGTSVAQQARYFSAQQLLTAKEAPRVQPRQREVQEWMNFYVEKALLGQLSPKQALTQAQRAIDKLLAS